MRIEEMTNGLNKTDEHRLKKIFEPQIVGVPAEDARRNICVMPDGEIRSYGLADKAKIFSQEDGRRVYLSSKNCGLDWRLCYAKSNHVMGACVQSPLSGKFLAIVSYSEDKKGTFARISMDGPEDEFYREVKICDIPMVDIFQPIFLKKWNRWACTAHIRKPGGIYHPMVMLSDDDGESWRVASLASTPYHEVKWPHQGMRWQNNGAEPSLIELSNGMIMLLARTSLDFLYQYFSADGGETWTEGECSKFHCTLTTPFLLKLSDGRILLFWNNSRPLAEMDQRKAFPSLGENYLQGKMEDVFTNRDVCHVAISEDDGKTWIGCRELMLSVIRNNSDFRSIGGMFSSADKSVHQFQAIELPYNKVLVELGQHEVSRKTVIFDVDWLYEKERHEDWQQGLKNLSTHMFVKSVSGCFMNKGMVGHCAWNRINGALLLPDPDGNGREVLQICRVRDERLVSDKQGAVWNFPTSNKGEVKLQVQVSGNGIRVNICDHWINPTDEYVGVYSACCFEIDGQMIEKDMWHEITICFDTEKECAELRCGEKILGIRQFTNAMPLGISYLHMQTLAEDTDYKGTYIRRMDFMGK